MNEEVHFIMVLDLTLADLSRWPSLTFARVQCSCDLCMGWGPGACPLMKICANSDQLSHRNTLKFIGWWEGVEGWTCCTDV